MKRNTQFLQGLLTATTAVVEITGELPMEGMSDQTWYLINKINARLLELATAEADALTGTDA